MGEEEENVRFRIQEVARADSYLTIVVISLLWLCTCMYVVPTLAVYVYIVEEGDIRSRIQEASYSGLAQLFSVQTIPELPV